MRRYTSAILHWLFVGFVLFSLLTFADQRGKFLHGVVAVIAILVVGLGMFAIVAVMNPTERSPGKPWWYRLYQIVFFQ